CRIRFTHRHIAAARSFDGWHDPVAAVPRAAFVRANGTPPPRRNRGKMKISPAGGAGSYGKGPHYGNTFARAKRAARLRVEGARQRCAPPERLKTE
ncbi:unnamed protein product, partial [marine sediment metagenome]